MGQKGKRQKRKRGLVAQTKVLPLMSFVEVCRYLSVGREFVKAEIESGRLMAYDISGGAGAWKNRRWRVHVTDSNRYLAARRSVVGFMGAGGRAVGGGSSDVGDGAGGSDGGEGGAAPAGDGSG